MTSTPENKPPILHIVVVGFHHKLGCQVEFSYPPLISGTSGKNECPSGWKYLPTLALPDGSHNFAEDTVYFNLPSLYEPTESVYGVSCYRQIPVEQLKIRTADVTRSTVQKSVCVLSRLPIYGYIEVKLALIADTFFGFGDFSCTALLVKAYQQLNACLLDDETRRPLRHFHVGLSPREILLQWKHKTLQLFKLFLLQRRVICFASPVREMCGLILGIASLMPRLLEKGFQEVACVRTSRPLSPMPDFTDSIKNEAVAIQQEKEQQLRQQQEAAKQQPAEVSPDGVSSAEMAYNSVANSTSNSAEVSLNDASPQSLCNQSNHGDLLREDSTESSSSLTREASMDTLASNLFALSAINPDEYRCPIPIFASGNLCLPYLSLPYMDLLTDPSVLSYVIGTSNVLFRQKRQLADVLIDIENFSIESHDAELRRQLHLSTEDSRFIEFVLKHVQSPKEDAEGSEHWIREQFQGYTLALLRTSVNNDATIKDADHFNVHFMQAFKRTQCYQEWHDVRPDMHFFDALPLGHPFAGTLSVADVKLRIAQTMQNSESGRKINQAVNTTSRAVGGAISQAKGAFSNWWSSMVTTQTQQQLSNDGNLDSNNKRLATTKSTTNMQQPTATVTFQNKQNEEVVEVAVSFHMEEELAAAAADIVTTNSQFQNASGKEVDSAEEILEDETSNKAPSDAEEAEQAQIQLLQQEQQKKHGIVEIGKEAAAAVIDANSSNTSSNCVDLSSATHQPGEVFIA